MIFKDHLSKLVNNIVRPSRSWTRIGFKTAGRNSIQKLHCFWSTPESLIAGARRAEVVSQGKAQLDRLEAMRKLFTKSRALSLAQRALLYAKDELEMCTMRMRVSFL